MDTEQTTGKVKIKFEEKIYFLSISQLSSMDKNMPISNPLDKIVKSGDASQRLRVSSMSSRLTRSAIN